MSRYLALLVGLGCAVPAQAQEPQSWSEVIGTRVEAVIRKGGLRGARVGVMVWDAADGRLVYERRADEMFTPASLTKVVTSAAALQLLTPQYRFTTEVYGQGRRVGTSWQGDVYLRSRGDPALIEERLWKLVADLADKGIQSIDGSLVIDDTYFDRERFGADWGPRTRAWYYAPNGAVSVNFNTTESRGRYLAIAADPSDHAARFCKDLLAREGVRLGAQVRIGEPVPADAVLLARSSSKPLSAIVADLNKVSNNFIAEQILKTLGAETVGEPGTALKGTRAISAYLGSLGITEGFEFSDGSGLSRSNSITPRNMVRVLDAVARDFEYGAEFVASLKVAGAEGRSPRYKDPLCLRKMRIKTGHLYGVSTLAGYAQTESGRRLVFAVMVNDYRRGRAAADHGIEQVCEAFLADGAGPGTPPLVALGVRRVPLSIVDDSAHSDEADDATDDDEVAAASAGDAP